MGTSSLLAGRGLRRAAVREPRWLAERLLGSGVADAEGTVRAGSPYRRSQRLFVRYPLAVRMANRDGTVRTMVLTVRDGDHAGFYVLLHDRGAEKDFSC